MAKKFNVVDTLENAFKTVFNEPEFMLLFVLPTVVMFGMMAMLGVTFLYSMGAAAPAYMGAGIFGYMVVFIAVIYILFSWAAASTVIKAEASSRRKRMKVSEAFSLGLSKTPKLIAANLIMTAIVVAGFVALIIPGIYLMVRLALVQPACVLDKKGLGIKSAWEASKGNFWRLFALMLLISVVSMVLSMVPLVGMFISLLVVSPAGLVAYVMAYRKLK